MNSFSLYLANPFTRSTFWGRQNELRVIRSRLLSDSPQSIAIIGEPYIGKTTLVNHLIHTQNTFIVDDRERERALTFVYLDCSPYIELTEVDEMGDYAAALFWWDFYGALHTGLKLDEQPPFSKPEVGTGQDLIDTALQIKMHVEEHVGIRGRQQPIIFVLDNFDVVARLHLRNAEWLRSMTRHNCAYVVTSRYQIYLLYQYHRENWARPSPFWNLFSDPIYLGLMSEKEVEDYILRASEQARESESYWKQRDIKLIQEIAGRHPALLRIACSRLFERRLSSSQSPERGYDKLDEEFLEYSILTGANPICTQLWRGLTKPELLDEPSIPGYSEEKDPPTLSRYQNALIEIASGHTPSDTKMLFVLEQRGLIERINREYRVFAEAMRQFILKQQEQNRLLADSGRPAATAQADTAAERRDDIPFTYLEGKVYEYLKAHAGEVCDREDIKRAVWEDNEPSDSALQKIIERIREKLEEVTKNPHELIAVRGRGYMLRENT